MRAAGLGQRNRSEDDGEDDAFEDDDAGDAGAPGRGRAPLVSGRDHADDDDRFEVV
jgi:hypothetical protein